ncbi:UV-resistance associated gene isoform X2 [Arctopsyche grandis]|uniref:UV-resistance associated gene isoform X2 n=1 Tax=Arctopsyche grandis TaxID=121162 RepID=UPI00406D98D9
MFGQPRCREWTPLATQQLRTRNLLQVVGYNMQSSDSSGQQGSLYYTLHSTTMSAPFYTSEKLLSNHPKWREIDSELIHKMSSLNIVVRVWRHIRHSSNGASSKCSQQTDQIIQTWGVNFSGLLHIGANLSLNFTPKSFKENTLIFQMIGGYFCSYEKLRLQSVSRETSDTSMVGKAASPSRKIPINSRHQRNVKESKSVSPGRGIWRSEGLDGKYVSKSHSPPNATAFRQNNSAESRVSSYVPSSRISNDSYKDRFYCDSQSDSVYEHSPKSEGDMEIREYSGSDSSNDNIKSCSSLSTSNRDLSNIEESETAENFDANLLPVPKCRYSSMKFLKSEIRPSYNAEKLRKLHLLQYSINKRSQAVQEIKEKIYQKSAMENCENLSPTHSLVDYEDFSRSENLSISSREFSFLTGKCKHTKGKDLGKILSECSKTNPMTENNKCSELKKDEECSEDAKHTLTEERDEGISISSNRRNFSRKLLGNTNSCDRRFTLPLNKLLEFKSQPSPSQRLRYACLTKQAELSRFKRRLLKDERDAILGKIRHLKEIRTKLFEENQDNGSDLMQKYHSLSRKSEQLKELRKSEAALGELCARSASLLWIRRWQLVQDIQIIYSIEEDEHGGLSILDIHLPACQGDSDGLRQVPEAHLAVALGRSAHVAALAAGLLAVPLRHPLRLMGSRTKVIDHLSSQNHEIPLFARNKDSVMFRYGLYLLNKNIVQLLWATHRIIPPDPKDTLSNLRKLLTPPPQSASLELSRYYGSASSVETAGVAGYALFHPFSAPSLIPVSVTLPQLVSSTSNPSVSTGAIRKVPHHSLRSLVAIGGDRSNRSLMVSGGFGNMGGRQFNRFKVLQSLEMSPTSVIGSEPSLMMHDSHTGAQLGESDPSDSPSDDIQNVMSFSESDLTKVSGILSSEAVSPGDDFGTKVENKVVFSVGDDFEQSQKVDRKKHSSKMIKQLSLEDNLLQSCMKEKAKRKSQKEVANLSKENVEIKNLQSHVTQLTKELTDLCITYSSGDSISTELKTCEVSDQNANTKLEERSKCEKENVKPNDCEMKRGSECPVIDIEKLDQISYCSELCEMNCPHVFEKITNRNDTEEIKDDTGNMDDVIVLPSAEAVMTASSHFNDSLSHSDVPGSESSEDNNHQLEVYDENATVPVESVMNIEPDEYDVDRISNCEMYVDDSESIYAGSNASHDANRLLEDLKLMEDNVLTIDGSVKSTQIEYLNESETRGVVGDVPSVSRADEVVYSNIPSDIR